MSSSDNPMSNSENRDAVDRKPSVSDHVSALQYSAAKSDSFVVNMERFSHLVEKDINANSSIARSLSRKGSGRTGEKKIAVDDRDATALSSPRATFHESGIPEKPVVVATGAVDHIVAPQGHHHHQITIGNGSAAAAESKLLSGGKRFSFRRSPHTWTIIDPRRILFFFATLSCMGTVLLIYFTLSIGKPSGEDNVLSGRYD